MTLDDLAKLQRALVGLVWRRLKARAAMACLSAAERLALTRWGRLGLPLVNLAGLLLGSKGAK